MVSLLIIRKGSPAHIAICRIHFLGGKANMSDIVGLLKPEYQTITAFRKHVIQELERFAFARVSGTTLTATSKGLHYAQKYAAEAILVNRPYVGQIVPPRKVPANRELNLKRHRAAAPFRPGANDHLLIPSLMGKTRKLPNGEVVE
jgi:hypothetical protein